MFDIGIEKFALLIVLALIIFGPDQLPRIARQAGQTLRQLRRMATDATSDLKAGLGPEYADLDLADLNPRRFVRRHLLDEIDEDDLRFSPHAPAGSGSSSGSGSGLGHGEHPPYDAEAT